ncbi:MAG: class I SAM-dependent methyltransferase [Nocardiopsaceae bacterium]|nr:class I SAM-dependent methyltransferase [Nocardiopsaceae bacterium]
MADAIFTEPRLAAIYDSLDPDRSDLAFYVGMAVEFGARSVLDIGCGTGTFCCMLACLGYTVTGVDPALASLDIARAKPYADRVTWVHGTGADLPLSLTADLATMTGNVAQVFTSDDEWASVLSAAYTVLRPGGHLIFETRDPAKRGWERWNPEQSFIRADIPGTGIVETWDEVTAVDGEWVTFRGTFVFRSDGAVLTSESTLRFRSREAVATSLATAGFTVSEVRDAPDRPGMEFVFVARRGA